VTSAPDVLYRDVAYIAYHFHWGLDDILDLEHPLRRRFVTAIDEMGGAPRLGS
jgi:hypothetical protein